jgi:hypothetical protein
VVLEDAGLLEVAVEFPEPDVVDVGADALGPAGGSVLGAFAR